MKKASTFTWSPLDKVAIAASSVRMPAHFDA